MLLRVENIHKSYRGPSSSLFDHRPQQQVLSNIHFHIESREIVGLVGESGSGKSTLARILMNLERPDSGKVIFMGNEITDAIPLALKKEFYQNCQIIFQDNLSSFNPAWTIQKSLLEPLINRQSCSKKAHLEKIAIMLKHVQLDEGILTRYPSQLSGGERQRVNILRSILLEPKLLICDEVVSSLDVIVQKNMIDLLKKINEELDMAILFISHDLHTVQYFCQKILVMKNGEIIDWQIKNSNSFQFSHPYSKALFSSILAADPAHRENR